VRNLIDSASKGGNYLLNVGPTAEGEIPAPSVERLAAIGRWMAVNSESIYGTTASPFAAQLPWGRATRKGDRLYLHVFDWPTNGVLNVPSFNGTIKSASLLGRNQAAVSVSHGDGAWTVKVPPQPPDPTASVIVLRSQ